MSSQPQAHHEEPDIRFDATYAQSAGIILGGVLLTIVTLGLYRPFHRTAMRRWRARHTLIHGSRLQYRAPLKSYVLLFVVQTVMYILTLGLYAPWGIVRSERHFWRHVTAEDGRTCAFEGRGSDLVGLMVVSILAVILTLGLAAPYVSFLIERWRLSHVSVGGERLKVTGTFGGLFLIKLAALLTPFTLGLILPWTVVAQYRWWAQASRCAVGTDATPQGPDALETWVERVVDSPITWIVAAVVVGGSVLFFLMMCGSCLSACAFG